MAIHARTALTPQGWANDVRLVVEDDRIRSILTGVPPRKDDERHQILLPAMPNVHSHAFQRAMAGLAEKAGRDSDGFWSWRDLMYRLALSMSPDQVEAVAAQLYVEMLEAGFSRVGEFHYLHHDADGRPYACIAEMAARIASAAARTGIGLTLLPVFYAHSGFGGAAPAVEQRRFVNDIDRFEMLLSACKALASDLPGSVTGIALHSLRAVTPDELTAVLAMDHDGPIHIHVAEQTKEVEDCIAWSGARPVEWLLASAGPDGRWCLVHATHMTLEETRRIADSGAVAGLCPVTEANLGDGTFAARAFLSEGGKFAIGSDSNVLIGIDDELRQLEYSQRLVYRARNVVAAAGRSTGRTLFETAVNGGAAALGVETGLAEGKPADFLTLRTRHPVGLAEDAILDRWLFARGAQIDCVWVRGKKLVVGGKHPDRQDIATRFEKVMGALLAGD